MPEPGHLPHNLNLPPKAHQRWREPIQFLSMQRALSATFYRNILIVSPPQQQSSASRSLLLFGSKLCFKANIGITLKRVLAVFTRSAITPPKVNRLGWNLEHSQHIVGSWPWHFGRDPRSSDSLRGRRNFFGPLNNARFHRFAVGQILRHLNTATSIGVAM